MKTKDDIIQEILQTRNNKKGGYEEYGANVVPAIEIFNKMKTFEERKVFQDALEEMLLSPDIEIQKFAVNLCLGFFVFKDSF